jgi:hypothetical protein
LLHYDETELLQKLSSLEGSGCGVFAASCAERLVHLVLGHPHRDASRDPEALRLALDVLWDALATRESRFGLAELVEGLDDLVIEDDAVDNQAPPYLQNAVAACIYALQTQLEGDCRSAIWAAREVTDALDFFIISRDDIDINAAGSAARVMSDPLLQAELHRQGFCLSRLITDGDSPSVVRECRALASASILLSP